jgi:hypothetical protein
MLLLAIDAARFDGNKLVWNCKITDNSGSSADVCARIVGAENIYIHVHKDNLPARRLYDHIGFKVLVSPFSFILF